MDMKLVFFKEDGSRKDIPVRPGTYVVGRNEQASIRIPLPSVSRAHCELVVTEDGARIRDLGSSNGTYQNSKRVDQADLRPGDVLGIGDIQMTVQINGEPRNIENPTSGPADAKPEPGTGDAVDSSGDSSMMDEAIDSAAAPATAANDSSDSFDLSFLDDDEDDDDNPKL
jgi:pSer/pThr/pTyr-binding forkhead associated (FHA) protein